MDPLKILMRRGEVWLVSLDPTVGTEINKTRPAVIVNDDGIGILPLKVVVPITDWKETYASRPWMVKLETDSDNGLSKTSGADTFQVRSVSEKRLIKLLGKIDDLTMQAISTALSLILSIEGEF
mgnify:CR=1 FL=1